MVLLSLHGLSKAELGQRSRPMEKHRLMSFIDPYFESRDGCWPKHLIWN